MSRFYAVISPDRQAVIVNTWEQCRILIERTPEAEFKSFPSVADARKFIEEGVKIQQVSDLEEQSHQGKRILSGYTYDIYTDGGCQVNPGGPGGYGVVILGDGEEVYQLSSGYLSTTNNRMEIMAVIKGLEAIPEGSHCNIYSDSQYVVNTITKGWSRNKNKDLWDVLDKLLELYNCRFIWVRGHNGNKYNEMCDGLATEAMQQEDLQVDEGYIAQFSTSSDGQKPQPTKKQSPAAANKSKVPEKYRSMFYGKTDPSKIHKECAEGIKYFLNPDAKRNFKSFKDLKTGGIDGYSQIPLHELEYGIGNELCAVFRNALADIDTDGRYLAAAIKWYMRGLSLEDAVHKVRVDFEINQNVLGIR